VLRGQRLNRSTESGSPHTAHRRERIEGEDGGGVADRLLRQPDAERSRTDREPQRWVEHDGLSVQSRIDGGSRVTSKVSAARDVSPGKRSGFPVVVAASNAPKALSSSTSSASTPSRRQIVAGAEFHHLDAALMAVLDEVVPLRLPPA